VHGRGVTHHDRGPQPAVLCGWCLPCPEATHGSVNWDWPDAPVGTTAPRHRLCVICGPQGGIWRAAPSTLRPNTTPTGAHFDCSATMPGVARGPYLMFRCEGQSTPRPPNLVQRRWMWRRWQDCVLFGGSGCDSTHPFLCHCDGTKPPIFVGCRPFSLGVSQPATHCRRRTLFGCRRRYNGGLLGSVDGCFCRRVLHRQPPCVDHDVAAALTMRRRPLGVDVIVPWAVPVVHCEGMCESSGRCVVDHWVDVGGAAARRPGLLRVDVRALGRGVLLYCGWM